MTNDTFRIPWHIDTNELTWFIGGSGAMLAMAIMCACIRR